MDDWYIDFTKYYVRIYISTTGSRFDANVSREVLRAFVLRCYSGKLIAVSHAYVCGPAGSWKSP